MRNVMKNFSLILVGILFITGCSITPHTATQIATYNFAVNALTDNTAQTTQKNVKDGKQILVAPITVPAWLDTRAIHYRLDYHDPVQSYTYAHSRWSSPPAFLLKQHITQSIANNTRHLVINDSSMAIAENKLHIELEEFSQIFNSKDKSHVTIRFRASIVNKSHHLVAQHIFTIRQNTPSADAIGAANAFSTASNRLVDDLVLWLQAELDRI